MIKRDVADRCFIATARTLRRFGFETLHDTCGNAAKVMRECLRRRGVQAEIVGRQFPRGQGKHFTVQTPDGELDPTIAFWPKHASYAGEVTRPIDAVPNALYRVRKGSPHGRWKKFPVDTDNMYACYSPTLQRKRG